MAEVGESESVSEADQNFESAAVGIALDRARARRGKPTGDDAADHFLAAQEALIADQRHHLHEQMRHMGLKHFSDRLKVALQLLTIAVGVALVATLGWMALDAAHADGVVIKPFTVAPDLARRGVTGEVVASQLLDKLTDISDRSQASNGVGTFGAGWGQNISLQIPETGVSLAEVDQFLRDKLGHEKRLTGEVTQNPDGTLTVVARLGARALPPQSGPATDMSQLIARTAESLYRREQPQTYEQYLAATGRPNEEWEAVGREEIESHDPVRRAVGYGHLGIVYAERGDGAAAIRNWQAADAEHAGLSWPAGNLAFGAVARGRLERSLVLLRRADALATHDPTYTRQAAAEARFAFQGGIAQLLLDHATAFDLRMALARGDNLGRSQSRESLALEAAEARALVHDGAQADADANAFVPRRPADVVAKAVSLWRIADDREDWQAALDRLALMPQSNSSRPYGLGRRALALAKLGRSAEAQAVVAPTPLDCQPCVIVRGFIAEAYGRRAEADHWFAEASRIAPSIPSGPLNWGQALLARGDAAKAAVQFREALRRSPRAEEALEGLGEALTLQGDAEGAVKQYAAGDKLTPKWGRNHLKWGEALAKLGDAARAKAQFALAAKLDLTAQERAELAAQKV
jgi:tetratricopeptide (TPR) repeat protein